MRKRIILRMCGAFLLILLIYGTDYSKRDFCGGEIEVATESENNKVEEYKEWQLPDYETEEEIRDYFLTKYPKANRYEVYPPKEDAEDIGNIYLINEDGCSYAYYQRAGKGYMVESRDISEHSLIDEIWYAEWEHYDYIARWSREEEGTRWYNYSNEVIRLEWSNGNGEMLIVECKAIPSDDEELENWNRVEVSVYREGEKEPFQTLVTSDYYSNNGQPRCYLTDINMDGYFDFEVYRHDFSRYSYVDDFVWSPSKSEFVEAPTEVQVFTSREYDEETRKIYVYHSHGQGNSVEYVYQWENEMDFRLVGLLETADESSDTMSFRIEAYEKDGSERVILDYITEEVWELEEFATELYYENVLCEKIIKSEELDMQYQIYYVQETQEDGGMTGGYDERIYVIDENLQPVTVLAGNAAAAYEGMIWIVDEQGEKLQILYEDGSMKNYALKDLLGKIKINIIKRGYLKNRKNTCETPSLLLVRFFHSPQTICFSLFHISRKICFN